MIRVGDTWWKLEWSDSLPAGSDGLCRYEDSTMLLRNGMGGDEEFFTLLHETLHAVFPYLSEDAVVSGELALRSAVEYWRSCQPEAEESDAE